MQEEHDVLDGATTRRKTILSTSVAGTGGTLAALASHGPAGLFAGMVATAALVALEYHGTPEEYAKFVSPMTRRVACWMRRTANRRVPKDAIDGPRADRLTQLATMPYQDYLQAPEWIARAKRIRARDGHTCQDCGRSDVPLDVHHLTYERRGHELDEDLITLCRTCHDARHGKPEPAAMSRPQLAPPVQAALRAGVGARSYFTFSEVLASGFVPSLQHIYLMTLVDGTQVFLPTSKMCHVALAGLTRGGKSHLIRLLMAQLCKAGAEVYHLDPHYTPYDLEAYDPAGRPCPEDWTPFLPYLANDPRELVPVEQKYQIIAHYLRGAKRMVDERMVLRGQSRPVGAPVFLFLDEVPAIVDNIPEAPGYLKSILREGAKVGVNVVTAAQDFLVKTLFPNEGGAVRDCYRTVLYVGGDPTTAKTLLDMAAKDVPENRLGKGRVMGRCDVVRPAQEARVPYVDNEALYTLLGPSTYTPEVTRTYEVTGPKLAPMTEYRQDRDTDPVQPIRSTSGARPRRDVAAIKQAREQRLRGVQAAARTREQNALPAELQRAYAAYESQMSYRDLGAKLGVGKDTAGKWIQRLQDRGYINEQGMKCV